jgi:hypothetical protein
VHQIEVAKFPTLATAPFDKKGIRANISLPDNSGTLTPEDTVVVTLLPSMDEIGITQPEVITLLEVMAGAMEQIKFKWLVLLQSSTYLDILKNPALPSDMLNKHMIIAGKKDTTNFYFENAALSQYLSCADIVVDASRDHVWSPLVHTALAWDMPVLNTQYGNVPVDTVGSDMFGKAFSAESAIKELVRLVRNRSQLGRSNAFKPNYPSIAQTLFNLVEEK